MWRRDRDAGQTAAGRILSVLGLSSVLDRVPPRSRPALFFESFYNIGTGGFVSLFLLSPVVLKTIIGGTEGHLALLGAMFGGSSLLSPLVSYLGNRISMKSLVVYPNLLVALFLFATAFPLGGASLFTLIVGTGFVVRVFPRVAEMNMFRVFYPPTHRGAAVGWVKAVAAVSGLTITLLGYWWFSYQPKLYWVLYCLVGVILIGSAWSYRQIPFRRNNVFRRDDLPPPHLAFWEGMKIFLSDRRFLFYQLGFSLAGFANHMAMVFIAEVLAEDVLAVKTIESIVPAMLHGLFFDRWQLDRMVINSLIVGLVFAVIPALMMTASAPFWGRFLDRVNPMIGRSIFNTIQCIAYAFHAYGGLTLQVWPFIVGAIFHAVGNGGSTINWLTGSMYFARTDRISLYNAVHVGLTGLRGLIAPLCGWYIISSRGLNLGAGIFVAASVLSILGAGVMLLQGLTDPGPRETV